MTYVDKERDMCRSVLPSTARRAAAVSMAHVRRSHRRKVRQQLRSLAGPATFAAERWDDAGPRLLSVGDHPQRAIGDVVRRRRGADKVGPVIRWATARTRHLPDPETRLAAMARVLPANLIGRHALSHLEGPLAVGGPQPHRVIRRLRLRTPAPVLAGDVRWALACGLHAELNQWLWCHPARHARHRRPPWGTGWRMLPVRPGDLLLVRLLLGWHDVDAFVADVNWHQGAIAREVAAWLHDVGRGQPS